MRSTSVWAAASSEVGVEGEEKVLALADVSDPLVVHAAKGVGDGLALGVEDRSL